MVIAYTNIKFLIQYEENIVNQILGHDMDRLNVLNNAYVIVKNGLIEAFGSMSDFPEQTFDEIIDFKGIHSLMPTWVDSHTHLVYAAPREQEFVDRIKGLSYEEIARNGGGILNSAAKMQQIDYQELLDKSQAELEALVALGTGAIEIKSGYGLTVDNELKMLRIIRDLKERNPKILIKSTFLGAHAYPLEYKSNHQGYIDLIINEMIPKVVDEGLAEYIDVFCEDGFFSIPETAMILEAGIKKGLKPKIHANQLHRSGGVQIGVQYDAISVDHLESMGEAEISCLQNSNTIPTLLPGAAFFLKMQYQPARALIDANLPVCVASDYNPGTCPSGNMNLMLSLACTQLRMTPNEAINAQTINGAAALEVTNKVGSIAVGKIANFIVLKDIPSVNFIPYAYGTNLIERVIIS